MSDLKSLLISLPAKYNDSADSLNCTLENIFIQIKNEKCLKKTGIAAVSVFSAICANLTKMQEHKYNISLKYMKLFVPALGCDYLNRGLSCIRFFIHYSFQQNKIEEIRNFFIDFDIQPTGTQDSLKIYFDINNLYYSRIIIAYKPSSIEVRKFFGNLAIIFEITQNKFPTQFLEFSESIFGQQNYIKLIFMYLKESEEFLNTYMHILSNLETIANVNNLYIHLTKVLIYFFQIESSKEFATNITKSLLQACLDNVEMKKNKNISDMFSIYYLIILLIDNDSQQQVKFQEVLQNYKLFLARDEIDEIDFMDAIITFIEKMYRISQGISINTNNYNCELIFDILELLLKYINEIKYSKQICLECCYHTQHQIYNLCSIGLSFYHRVIILNLTNENTDKFILNILKISLDLKKKFKCKSSDKILLTLVSNCLKYIKYIKTVERTKYGIALLDLIVNSSYVEALGKLNILKLYKQYYEIIQDKENLLIIQALIILNLIADEKYFRYISSEFPIFIKYLIDTKNKPDTLICDVIPDSKCNLKPRISNISYILQQQIEILVQKKIINTQELENLVLKSIDKINSNLEFALIVRNVNIITDKILLQKVNNVIKIITNNLHKLNDNLYTFENNYALAILYKREAMQLFEQLKNINIKEMCNDSFENLINMELDEFNIKVENSAINIALLSIQHFSCILPHLTNEKCTKTINWINLFDDVSVLARQHESRGYMDHAYEAWKLVYNISTDYHICNFQQMRAVSYFCKHFDIINVLDKKFNIETAINSLSKEILKAFKNIDLLTPRKQNYVLFCILDMAYFYAEKNDMQSCNALMSMVAHKVSQMESRKPYFELVRARLCALEFHLSTKFGMILKRSPYNFIASVLKEVKNIQYITSEDSINTINFLLNFIEEVVYFLMSMNEVKKISLFIVMIAKYSLNAGFIFRFIKILLSWAHMNLEAEEYHDCQMKLLIANKLMLIENELKIDDFQNENDDNVLPKQSDNTLHIMSQNQFLALTQIRKVSERTLSSPERTISSNKSSLLRYLNNHHTNCTCELCKHSIFKMIQLKIGCLYARMYYLNSNTTVSEEFFEKSLNWWNEINFDYAKLIFNHFRIWMMIYYINTLRSNKKFDKGNEICEFALQCIKSSSKKIDLGCYWKIIEQQEAIKYIISKINPINISENNETRSNSKRSVRY